MKEWTNRREFLRDTTIFGAGLAGLGMASNLRAADEPKADAAQAAKAAGAPADKPFVMGIIGTGGRGQTVAANFASSKGVAVKYVCDVDDAMLADGVAAVEERLATLAQSNATKPQFPTPTAVKDFRRVLDDDAVQAVAVVTPDHWHAPIAILALKAGKHVYVEKPCCHIPREGELLVEAARKYNRVVQHGTQRRSWPGIVKGIKLVRGGEIGNVHFARCWYAVDRKSIGRGKGVPVPPGMDFTMWQGPAPERPYQDNLVPYNWHWFWHWGTGEMGNNGIHFLDLARWGLNVDYPKRVTSAGGRYAFDDDWETPDTQTATFEFGDKMILAELRSCHPRGIDGAGYGVAFHGDKGTLVVLENGFKLYDRKDKLLESVAEKRDIDTAHFADFVDAARKGRRPAAEIEDGHKSTLLCHLGNIAIRAGKSLNIDPKNGRILDDKETAEKYWSREYRPEWEPTV
jgi:predicted dehydrogenase